MTHPEPTSPLPAQISNEWRHTGPFVPPQVALVSHHIRTSCLSFAYPATAVFRELTLETEGRIIVLRGPSGCGKTTLLKLFAAILMAGGGEIGPEFKRPVLISQEDALFPWLTGVQNILKIARVTLRDLKSSPLYPRIEGFVGRRAYQMSFGQRRLIEITRALLIKPDLLCLDEPFNFIDPPSRALIQNLLLNPLDEFRDTTLLVSSHYESDFSAQGVTDLTFDGNLPVSKLAVSSRL